MEHRLPPLNALRAFEAAARLGSFSAAAESLNVTHGAISRQVRGLEDWLGTALFERRGKRIVLNKHGRDYLHAIQSSFGTIAAATRHLVEAGAKRQIMIDVQPTFSLHWLLPRLTRFQVRYPAIELRLTSSGRVLSPAGGFDIAIRRGLLELPGCIAQKFLDDYEIPVCSPALLRRIPLAKACDLKHHTLLSAEPRENSWRRWLAAAGVPRLVSAGHQHFELYYLTVQAAIDGLGVALGARPVIDHELATGRLVAPLAGPMLRSRGYYWVIPSERASDAALRAFCDWLEEEAGQDEVPLDHMRDE